MICLSSCKQIVFIVLLAFIRSTLEANPIKANYAPKIVNGDNTTIEKWPFLVQIVYKNSYYCGGSVITNRWVLTAAHCIPDNKSAHFIIYADSTTWKNGTIYHVETIKVHEHYNLDIVQQITTADVALIHIKGEFRFSNTLRTIKVDFAARQFDTDYTKCSTAGWGAMNADGHGYAGLNLQVLDVETVLHDDCKLKFPVLRSNVCSRAVKRPGSPCSGDSGGPLACNGVLVGVVSYVEEDCTGLTAYAKVASFYTWMNTYMKKFEKKIGLS